ncbi:MAG: peptide chain release factor N(5)-glutamine methyltransferase [Candidatus Neomarinimicrobiota bacterium]
MNQPAQKEDRTWRVIDIINWAKEYLKSKDFENPRREIEWLLQDLLGCSRVDLYLRFEELLGRSELETLKIWVKRRIEREPLQYITGKTEFYGREFAVDKNVLIPRPETEQLIETVLETIGKDGNPKILDIGTGSGCIGVTLAAEIPAAVVDATDVNDKILSVAMKNTKSHGLENIRFLKSDFLNDEISHQYDLAVCNPPYIPIGEMSGLAVEIRDYEPSIALTDNQDGLLFYRRMTEKAQQIVRKGGWIICEVGLGSHPGKAHRLFAMKGFESVELIKDLNGDDRVLKVRVN